PDERRGADHAAVHPVHHRRGRTGLARRCCRNYAVRRPDRPVHRVVAQAPVARHHLRSRTQMSRSALAKGGASPCFRRAPREAVGMALIGGGIIMLVQPWSIDLYSYSFVTILAGTVGYVIVSHYPE